MRSNSGGGKGSNNMHDPTVRDRSLGRDLRKSPLHGRTTEMGSSARKKGQKGSGGHR